jgi:hypothetical protein
MKITERREKGIPLSFPFLFPSSFLFFFSFLSRARFLPIKIGHIFVLHENVEQRPAMKIHARETALPLALLSSSYPTYRKHPTGEERKGDASRYAVIPRSEAKRERREKKRKNRKEKKKKGNQLSIVMKRDNRT